MTPSVVESVTIDAPPQRVWETVMDASRLGEWVTAHDDAEGAPSRLLESGDEFTQTLKLAGRSFDVRWRVAEAEPPRLARWEGAGPARSTAMVRYALEEEEDGGTRFDYENEFALPGGLLGRAASGLLAAAPGGREARRSLARLKRLLEGPGG